MTNIDGQEQFPLKVTLAAMNDRTRAMIEYYIDRSKNQFFSIAQSADTPDVIIIDHDHPGTAARLASHQWRTDIPIVVMAVGNVQVEGAIMVRKPLESASLETAASTALEQLKNRKASAEKAAHADLEQDESTDALRIATVGAQSLPKLTRRASDTDTTYSDTPTYFRTSDAALPGPPTLSTLTKVQRYSAKIELLCGPARTLDDLRDPYDKQHRYDPSQCLAGKIARVASGSEPGLKAVQFELPEANVFVLPTLNKVYCSLSLEYKRNVQSLFRDWNDSDVTVHKFDNANVNQVVDRVNRSPRFSFGLQSFCWLSSLFSTRGRLPAGFDIDTQCKLYHWPNITRLELTPDSLEIAAAWSYKAASLQQIVKQVRCEPRHAVSFLNAARTINLMDLGH